MIEYINKLWLWAVTHEVAAMTLFISILALLGTWIQATAARTQNKLSVRPYLHTYTEIETVNNQMVVLVKLANTGLGPALIDDYYVYSNGEEYRDDDIFHLLAQHFSACEAVIIRPKASIAINYSQVILKLPVTPENAKQDDLQEYLKNNFDLRIRYKSFLNECFLYSSSKSHEWPFRIRWLSRQNA